MSNSPPSRKRRHDDSSSSSSSSSHHIKRERSHDSSHRHSSSSSSSSSSRSNHDRSSGSGSGSVHGKERVSRFGPAPTTTPTATLDIKPKIVDENAQLEALLMADVQSMKREAEAKERAARQARWEAQQKARGKTIEEGGQGQRGPRRDQDKDKQAGDDHRPPGARRDGNESHNQQRPERQGAGGGSRDGAGRKEGASAPQSSSSSSASAEGETKAAPEAPNYAPSGLLAKEEHSKTGVLVSYSEPPDARKPDKYWRLYVFKNDKPMDEPLRIHRQSMYLVGKNQQVADLPILHPSCSKQHAVIQFRQREVTDPDTGDVTLKVKPYIIDLNSTNGTFVCGKRIESARYIELLEKDVIRFGESTREYVLLHTEVLTEEEKASERRQDQVDKQKQMRKI